MLDTNVVIYLRDDERVVAERVAALEGQVAISVITRVELEGGAAADPRRRLRLDAMLNMLPSISFDTAAADAYRRIVETAGFNRRKITDRMIAAQALAHEATLVTMNADDFKDVPGLKMLAWA